MRSVLAIILGFFLICSAASALNYVDSALLSADKNYIKNGGAEAGRAGWITYADAAGTTPVDCTGGSPVSTWTTSSSTPISGQYSFIWTHSAANRQGEGASYAFTIDKSDQARQMSVSFDYEVASGTFTAGVVPIGGVTAVDSDLEVYVYDVTNATLIQPSNFRLLGNSGEQKYTGTFQTASNSQSYRLCLHAATTTTTAHTLRIDSVKVGPQIQTTGPPVSDWQSYTPTFTGFGTATSINFLYRRIGDSLEVAGSFTTGTATATEARISLPSGLSIQSLSSDLDVGEWAETTNSAYNRGVVWASSGLTYIRFGVTSSGTAAGVSPGSYRNGNNFSNSSGEYVRFKVPISGWASNVAMGAAEDGRVLAFYVSPSAPTGTLTSSYNTASFGAASVDTHGAWNGTSTYTFPIGGYFNLSAAVNLTDASASNAFEGIQFLVNGSTAVGQSVIRNSSTSSHSVTTALTGYHFNAGDTVVVQVQSAAGTPAFTSGTGVHWFSIAKAPGPAQLAASDTVAARLAKSGTESVNGSTKVTGFTATFDKTGSWDGTNNKYNFPVPGTYQICENWLIGAVAGNLAQYKINGGSTVSMGGDGGTDGQQRSGGCALVNVKAGDYYEPYVFTGSSQTLQAGDNDSYITVHRIGN